MVTTAVLPWTLLMSARCCHILQHKNYGAFMRRRLAIKKICQHNKCIKSSVLYFLNNICTREKVDSLSIAAIGNNCWWAVCRVDERRRTSEDIGASLYSDALRWKEDKKQARPECGRSNSSTCMSATRNKTTTLLTARNVVVMYVYYCTAAVWVKYEFF